MQTNFVVNEVAYPVGARVEIRDAEWRIASVDSVKGGGQLLKCVGLSSIVSGRVAYFFSDYEDSIKLLLPETTELIQDTSSGFLKTRLYLESIFRTSPKTRNDKIYVAHKAAMNPLPYQFDPTLQALEQPRPRILIADAVGIGKTLEAGILTSELIARGRGKRILVLATKAVLSQFQQEFWNRFSIPLTALDSSGIRQIERKIPSNQNPFFFFDKAIISIDTLKKDEKYREFISKAHWDIIIIDEAHNVAQRSQRSQRSKLAQLLSGRSDAMIMLTATPHDGSAESFASLLNILDPTAISDPSNYKPSDYKDEGLVIRRFKNDIKDQLKENFPQRKIETFEVNASEEEQAVLAVLENVTFETLDNQKKKPGGAQLFGTTLIKSFFSSPAACISLINNRINTLKKSGNSQTDNDITTLENIRTLVEKVQVQNFSKLKKLAELLDPNNSSIGWNPKKTDDRIVVFTESIKTLEFLKKQLPQLTKLQEDQIATLKGLDMSDLDISKVVNEFNREESKYRVLLASDVASEGLNLHYLSHRMIHFDIPWSLMIFQQRNGRIDRYGQKQRPEIYYLQTLGKTTKIIGDAKVLEKLIERDKKVQENLNDPLEFLSPEEQLDVVEEAIESQTPNNNGGQALEDYLASVLKFSDEDIVKNVSGLARVTSEEEFEEKVASETYLFKDDLDFAVSALKEIQRTDGLTENELRIEGQNIELQPPADLQNRLTYLPSEIMPSDNRFKLTINRDVVQQATKEARSEGQSWANKQLLWPNHPIMEWLEERLLGLFGRNVAPLLKLSNLDPDESWILLQGGFPNRAGYIPVHEFVAVAFRTDKEGTPVEVTAHQLSDLLERIQLNDNVSNTGELGDSKLIKNLLPTAIREARKVISGAKEDYEKENNPKLEARLNKLSHLKQEQENKIKDGKEDKELTPRQREKINNLSAQFENAEQFQKNNALLADTPYLQLIAAFTGIRKEED